MAENSKSPARLLEYADRLLSPQMLDSDTETLRRARFVAMFVAIAVAVCSGFVALHLWKGDVGRAMFVSLSIIPVLFALVLFRRPQGLLPATHFLLAVMLGMIVVSPMMSANAPNIFLGAIILPLVAVAMGGIRSGWIWTGAVALVLAASAIQSPLTPDQRLVAWNSVLVAVGIGAFAILFEESRLRANRKIDEFSERIHQDAALRLEVENALASSQAMLAKAFESTPAILILSELASGRIIRTNDNFARLSGWSQEEALGRTLTELNAWAAPEDRDRLFELVVDKAHVPTVELRLRRKSGAEIWLLASAAIVELNGTAHVLVQGIDITDRKHGEQALERYRCLLEERVEERSEQLRESRVKLQEQQRLAAVGTLTAGIAHQINNPIGGIMAAAELALLSDDEPDREMLRTRALETTVEEAGRCGRIIRNMLKFSRHEPTAKWVEDLNAIVHRATELTRPYVLECGGSLEVDIPPGRLFAKVSPIDIEQVLVNVIRNAAESRIGGARVIVSTRRNSDSEVSIEIADDGGGIAEEHREYVFDPFFTTRLDLGGSGLGLSVAHGVVKDHGGTLDLVSEPEKGTRVIVRLPLENLGSG